MLSGCFAVVATQSQLSDLRAVNLAFPFEVGLERELSSLDAPSVERAETSG